MLISAPSVEAIRRGQYQLVLGEVHLATNTLRAALFLANHPRKEELQQAMDRDVPEPRIIPWLSKSQEGTGGAADPLGLAPLATSARLDIALCSAKDLRVALAPDPPASTFLSATSWSRRTALTWW